MEFLEEVDDAVLEYLAFRGLINSSLMFVREGKTQLGEGFASDAGEKFEDEKDAGIAPFCANKVAGMLLDFARAGELDKMIELWHFLSERLRLFHHPLSGELIETAAKLESGLLKYFLVHAKRDGHDKVVMNFLERRVFEAEGLDASEGRAWCALPFCNVPEEDEYFAPFFQDEWLRLFSLSLKNFMTQTFRHKSAPKLLAFPLGKRREEALAAELKASEIERSRLQDEIERLNLMLTNRNTVKSCLDNGTDKRILMKQPIMDTENLGYSNSAQPVENDWLKPIAQERHCAKVNKCAFDGSGTILASASSDSTVRLWTWGNSTNEEPMELVQDRVLYCPSDALSLAWHGEHSRLLAVGTSSNVVKVWNVNDKREVGHILVSEELSCPNVVGIDFCPRKSLLATTSTSMHGGMTRFLRRRQASSRSIPSSMLCLWNSSTLQQCGTFDLNGIKVNSAVFNHNGSMLITGSSDGLIRVFDILKATTIMQWSVGSKDSSVSKVCLTADETGVICLTENGEISIWSLHTSNEAIDVFKNESDHSHNLQNRRTDYTDGLCYGDIILHDDYGPGRFMVTSPSFDPGTVRVYDPSSHSQWNFKTQNSRHLTSLDWDPRRSLLACTSLDKTVELYHCPSLLFT